MNNNTKILFGTFLKLELRDKENSGLKKFIGIIVSYLFAISAISMNSFIGFDKESFAILSFSTGVFLIVFVVLNDFGNIFFLKRHIDSIGSLPVSKAELVKAKFFSAIAYLSIYALVVDLPQTIFYFMYEKNYVESSVFFVSYIFSLFFILGIILFLYTVSVKVFSGKSNFVLYILQFLFFIYVIYISGFSAKKTPGKIDILSLGFVKYTPQFYFAKAINNPLLLSELILLTLGIYILYYFYLRKNYFKISEILYSIKDTIKNKTGKKSIFTGFNEFICDKFVMGNEEKASYMLTLSLVSKSRQLKMKLIPLTFIAPVVCLISVFTGTVMFKPDDLSAGAILTPSVLFTFLMCVKLLISATKIEDENSDDIKWLYSSLPIVSKKRILNANIKFVFANFAMPMALVILLITGFVEDIKYISLNMVFIFSAAYFVVTLFLLFDKTLPYTLESTKFNSVSKFGEIMFLMLIGVVIFVSQIFIFENVIFVIISVLLFFTASVALKKRQFTLIK